MHTLNPILKMEDYGTIIEKEDNEDVLWTSLWTTHRAVVWATRYVRYSRI